MAEWKEFIMKKMNKGFTLIELLVVVAIIGILASVVLASLNTARSKGADAAIKANLDNMRAQAAIVYDSANTYGNSNTCVIAVDGTTTGTCVGIGADATTLSGLKAAASASGNPVYLNTDSTGAQYVIVAGLKSPSPAAYWCVDSSGKSEQLTGATPTTLGQTLNTVCP